MTVRAFIALALPPATRAALVTACEAFVSVAPEWAEEKWVAEENLHVTVKFLGGIDEGAVDAVAASLQVVCAEHRPFAITLGDIVPRPGGSHTRMLWASVADGSEPARRLASSVDGAMSALLGIPVEERRYSPHITLVRVRRPHRAPADALSAGNRVLDSFSTSCGVEGHAAGVVSVRGVSVMSSRTLRTGPVYEELAFVPLGNV